MDAPCYSHAYHDQKVAERADKEYRDEADVHNQAKHKAKWCSTQPAAKAAIFGERFPASVRHCKWTVKHEHKRPPDRAKHAFGNHYADLACYASLSPITRFHIFVHHFDTAAPHHAKVIVRGRSTGSARPTELILAEATSHVIATLILLNLCAAQRTEGYVVFVFVSPAFELLFHCIFACYVCTMPNITALEADFGRALRARQLGFFYVFSLHMCFTAWFWAPAYQRIRVESLLVSKSLVLLQELSQVALTQNSFDSGFSYFRLRALEIEALQLLDLGFLDEAFELLDGALGAETMLAVELDGVLVALRNELVCRYNFICVADRAICRFFLVRV